MARLVRQNRTHKRFARDVALAFKQEEEECLVLDDGSADTSAVLIPIVVILPNPIEVVEPRVGVERRISICPKNAAAELVGSRSCHHLNLARTSRSLCVRGRDDDANFFHEVGARICCGERAILISAIADDDTVARRIREAEPVAGKNAFKPAAGLVTALGA